MDFIEAEFYLREYMKDVVEEKYLASSGIVFLELKNKFDFSDADLFKICYTCPSVLTKNRLVFFNNLNTLSQYFNLKDIEMKYLILKLPFILIMNESFLRKQTELISNVFGCSFKDVLKLFYQNPELLFLSKSFIKAQVEMLATELNEYGLKIRTLLRQEPNIIFYDKAEIEDVKKYLMKAFTLSEEESLLVIKTNPHVVYFGVEWLSKKFDFYYQHYFIKRDLKEILIKCPEFIMLDTNEVFGKIEQLMRVFNVEKKKICDFIRLEPSVLFFDFPVNRIRNFLKYNINLSYVLSAPSLCVTPEISIPLKFIITRMLALEDRFNEVCEMDFNLFISRFLFMQSYGFYDHKDLLETEEFFKEKYHISSRLLLISYKLDYEALSNLCLSYVNMKDEIKHWSDLFFPTYEDILKYSHSGFDKNKKIHTGYIVSRDDLLFTKRMFDVYYALSDLQLNNEEILMIMKKNFSFNKFNGTDVKKLMVEICKYGFTQEQIIKLLINRPQLFNCGLRDFEMLLKEICEHEECDEFTAILKYM